MKTANDINKASEKPTETQVVGENLGQGDLEIFKGPMKPLEAFNLMGEIANKEAEFENFFIQTLTDLGYSKNMTFEQKSNLVNEATRILKEKYGDILSKFNF